MEEGFRYHTTVSLHINMFDATADSPLWDTYLKNDIIAKDKPEPQKSHLVIPVKDGHITLTLTAGQGMTVRPAP